MSHRGSSSFDVSQLASQSPPDLRVRSDMWKGQIPVMFHLAPHEVTSMEDPPPLAVRRHIRSASLCSHSHVLSAALCPNLVWMTHTQLFRVPLSFRLAQMLVPRMSYFPLVLADVRSHFRDMSTAHCEAYSG